MAAKSSIAVAYKHVEGWHVFTSEELPGLYVASRNAERAYSDVAIAIQKLLKLDFGQDVTVAPESPLSVFLAQRGTRQRRSPVQAIARARAGARTAMRPVLSSRRYAVACHP